MYVFEYLRFNFKTQDFAMRLPIKAQSVNSEMQCRKSQLVFGATGMKK